MTDLVRRHIWLVDLLDKYGKLSRKEISDLWQNSSIGDGNPLPERTFHHHRRAVEDLFHINIRCNSAGEYFIENFDRPRDLSFRRFLINSFIINGTLAENPEMAEFIMVEDIPSSREFLPIVVEAIKGNKKVVFDYGGFTRVIPDKGIHYSPFFVKLYKQRWYMVGIKESIGKMRTYALDRVIGMNILNEPASPQGKYSPEEFFSTCLGVTQSMSPPRTVKLKVDSRQAKYFRALPMHHSQKEEFVCPGFSIFSYKLKINYELIHEIVGFGSAVVVEAPAELRLQVTNELQRSLANY